MRILGLAALLLAACGPAQAVLDDVDPNGEDTGGDPIDGDDTGTDTDTGPSDTGGNTEPNLTSWNGTRTFSFDDVLGTPCTDTVEETGDNVTDDIDYHGALEVCASCDEIYEIEVSPATLCEEETGGQGIPVATPIMRGIEFTEGTGVIVYAIRYSDWQGWSSEQLAEGTLEGSNVNVVEAMVGMIALARQFDLQMRMMQTAEGNEQKAAQLLSIDG